LTIEKSGYIKNHNPFILSELPLNLGLDKNGSLLFYPKVEKSLQKDIQNSLYPIELPILHETNTVRHFIPRLAKYLNACENGGITPNFYYLYFNRYGVSNACVSHIPVNSLWHVMENYFDFVYKSPSKPLLEHHMNGVIKMLQEKNFTQPIIKDYILTPFCSAFLSTAAGVPINVEIRLAGQNMATTLQRYFETNQTQHKNLREIMSLFHVGCIAHLARLPHGQVNEWVSYISQYEHTFSTVRLEKSASSSAQFGFSISATSASSNSLVGSSVSFAYSSNQKTVRKPHSYSSSSTTSGSPSSSTTEMQVDPAVFIPNR
jgi:hypothetical protein